MAKPQEETAQTVKESSADTTASSNHRNSVVSKLNSIGHKHTDAETKVNPNPQSTREALHNMQSNTEGNLEGKGE